MSLSGEQGDAATPGVAEEVARFQAKCLGEGGEVSRIELDAGCPGAGRDGGGTPSALVVENQLSSAGEWCERRPEQGVIEDESAVDADER